MLVDVVKSYNLNSVQKAALSLMQNDLRYLYTVKKFFRIGKSNYIASLMPYIGVIIDGIEDWINAFNNTNKVKMDMEVFTENEQDYYQKMRDSIKLWQNEYEEIYNLLENAYYLSKTYFSNLCKPIAKILRLYDIFGVDTANGAICGNTILCYYYNPLFSYDNDNGEYIKSMSEIGGQYIALFGADKEYRVDSNIKFDMNNYGGFIKSPVGNKFSDKFVLFSILCQINFIVYCVDRWIVEEISTKMRLAYLLYYSLIHVIPQINEKIGIKLNISDKWKSSKFRNAMAHYKLGIDLKKEELIYDDILFGLTRHSINISSESLYLKGFLGS